MCWPILQATCCEWSDQGIINDQEAYRAFCIIELRPTHDHKTKEKHLHESKSKNQSSHEHWRNHPRCRPLHIAWWTRNSNDRLFDGLSTGVSLVPLTRIAKPEPTIILQKGSLSNLSSMPSLLPPSCHKGSSRQWRNHHRPACLHRMWPLLRVVPN